jgi:hypothetical protein
MQEPRVCEALHKAAICQAREQIRWQNGAFLHVNAFQKRYISMKYEP